MLSSNLWPCAAMCVADRLYKASSAGEAAWLRPGRLLPGQQKHSRKDDTVFREKISLSRADAAVWCIALPQRNSVAVSGSSHYLACMRRLLRSFLMALVVLGLALAGPVQANCAPPPAAASTPCGDMAVGGATDEQPPPDAPAKACAIIQCPTTPPAVTQAARGVREPTSHVARPMMVPGRTMASADPIPEQRPPIS